MEEEKKNLTYSGVLIRKEEKKKIMSYSGVKRDRSFQLKIRKEEKQKKNHHLNNLS